MRLAPWIVAACLAAAPVARAQSDDEDARAGWELFLADRVPESIARYAAVLDRFDTGAAHDEALLMIAAMLADVDWDRDGVIDSASPEARLFDPSLVPQDRAWLAELAFETAHALYVSSRDAAAIVVLDAALARWPAPPHGTAIEPACRRHRARPTTLRGEDPVRRVATDALCARHGA